MKSRTNRILILTVLAGILFLLTTNPAKGAVPVTQCGEDMLECPTITEKFRTDTSKPTASEPAPTIPPMTVEPIETCPDNWQSSGPHPCPGGQGNGNQVGMFDNANPTPNPKRGE